MLAPIFKLVCLTTQTGEKQKVCVCVCARECVTKTERLITFFLVQHSERLHQLMFGTLHQSQPSFAFFLKCSEQTKKMVTATIMSFSVRCKHVNIRLNYRETGVQAVTLWHNINHLKLNQQKLFLPWKNGSAKQTFLEAQISHVHDNSSFIRFTTFAQTVIHFAVIVVLTKNVNQHLNYFTLHEKT